MHSLKIFILTTVLFFSFDVLADSYNLDRVKDSYPSSFKALFQNYWPLIIFSFSFWVVIIDAKSQSYKRVTFWSILIPIIITIVSLYFAFIW